MGLISWRRPSRSGKREEREGLTEKEETGGSGKRKWVEGEQDRERICEDQRNNIRK